MRESFGSTWTLQLVFGFTLLFVAFITVTISYSKAFRIKNEVISIIEKYGGYNSSAAEVINGYLEASGYIANGNCDYTGDAIGVNNLSDSHPSTSSYNRKTRYAYCIKKETVRSGERIAISDVTYEVTTFYSFNVPIIGRFATFSVKGKTTDMMDPARSSREHDCFQGC